ncbi:MAG: pyruvate carboxylase subunit B [Chitinispirillia bacterium]|nr:pyruvate carboxylase subunit B [Chitinispirillia bacterium]MCL2241077.1 pyruvate carboxylase subunit B [Chitinispirillia bacterium]
MSVTKRLKTEDLRHGIPLRITDTTLRDAHQSLWATRMRTGDILKIIDVIDNVGYYTLEAWGGATFDVCLRFLREDPWERLRLIKSKARNTPVQMLLRGQNLVGYRNYADDVVDRFVALACRNGVDIFRVFDALNDTRNLEAAIKAVKKHGGHAQGTLAYTISPVHTVDKYVQYAREQAALGIDSICIKDMAGILSPIMAERLVTALYDEFGADLPIQLHCHATSGMAVSAYVEGARAGAGAIDCSISSMAGAASQPPVETMVAIFSETNYSAKLDIEALDTAAKYFAALAERRCAAPPPAMSIDPGILIHQIPGGMISNFRSQLQMQKALDRLPEVLDEVSRVREDLGYPPLVTPTSQIVGTQAVMNILSGERYKMVPKEVKDYVMGLYGRSPAPIDKGIIKKILGNEKPINYRPADKIEPMLPKSTYSVDPALIKGEEDILSYVLLPEPALEYFRWKALPADKRPEIPADLELKAAGKLAQMGKDAGDGADKQSAAPAAPAAPSAPAVQASPASHIPIDGVAAELIQKIDGLVIDQIVFRKGDSTISVRSSGPAQPGPSAAGAASIPLMTHSSLMPQTHAAAPAQSAQPAAAPQEAAKEEAAFAKTIKAPLVGTFYFAPGPGKSAFVKEGDIVEKGAKVCIIEAMKLFNEISAPSRCKIVKMLVADGTAVDKDQPLFGIEEL